MEKKFLFRVIESMAQSQLSPALNGAGQIVAIR
jgi:hypothetical protein